MLEPFRLVFRGNLEHAVGVCLVVLLSCGVGDAVQGFLSIFPLLLGLELVLGLSRAALCGCGLVVALASVAAAVA